MDGKDEGLSVGDPAPEMRRPEPFRFADPRQERIFHRLQSIGPGPAAYYRDACRLMALDPKLDATSHLVAHLYREIESAVRDVLESLIVAPQHRTGKAPGPRQDGHKTEIRAILSALGIAETDPVAVAWLGLAGKKNEYGLHGRAHRDNLAAPRPVDQEFIHCVRDFEAVLYAVTARHEEKYLRHIAVLDELLGKKTPARADTDKLRQHVPNNHVTFSYFFDRLESPDWLDALSDADLFARPPTPEQREDPTHGTLISFLSWPQARYLARMAPLASEKVHEIMMGIPSTDNDRIHVDLAEAACQLPPALAADWTRREADWITSRSHLGLNLPDALGKLVVHLAGGGQDPAALELAKALFAVLPDQRKVPEDGDHKMFWGPEPHPRLDVWTYRRQVELCFPSLTEAVGLAALALACDLLAEAIRLSRPPGQEDSDGDLSYVWHQGIESGASHDFKGMLVCAVRDTAERLIDSKGKGVLEAIEDRKYKVFTRIGLHLRRKQPAVDPEGTARLLSDPAVLKDVNLQHERYHLLKEQFAELPQEAQQAYLKWVEEGPDVQSWLDWRAREFSARPSAKDGDRYARHWGYERLLPVQNSLPDVWKSKLEVLKAEFPSEPEHPDYPVWVETRSGSEAPQSAEDLKNMTVADLVSYVKSWQPSNDAFGPSREGLADSLAKAVSADPDRYTAEAELFHDVEPTYVRAVLQGLGDAVRQGRPIDWKPVLELARWVAEQPRRHPEPETGVDDDRDPGWGWSHRTLTDLVPNGLKEGLAEIPFERRKEVWAVLERLTHDPDPSPEDEAGRTDLIAAAVTVAINSVLALQRHLSEPVTTLS